MSRHVKLLIYVLLIGALFTNFKWYDLFIPPSNELLFIIASVKNDYMACLIILFSVAEVEAAELTIFLMMKGCELLKFLPYRHYSSETCVFKLC